MDQKVFRLRQIPINADRPFTRKLLSTALGIQPNTVCISSLARSVNPYEVTKVATLTFKHTRNVGAILEKPPEGSSIVQQGDEWHITADLDDLNKPVKLIIDVHFKGLTPLHDPKLHESDCIAISGLASHPFGSWQPKGGPRTFMWIRDDLPRLLPNVRPILYGYDTTLQDPSSFQLIDDLSLKLIWQLRTHGWSLPGRKPLVFLAHSLGGLILKQAIVTAADKLEPDNPIVRSAQGAIFFGTPNYGMEQSHLMQMVKGQYNEKLIADLSPNSSYLQRLDGQFSGISFLQKSQLYWCYETKASPTVTRDASGKWTRTGDEYILVTRESATRGLREGRSGLESIIPINENHSEMVKFSRNSPDLTDIIHALEQIIMPTSRVRQGTNNISDASNPLKRPSLTPEGDKSEEERLDGLITSLVTPNTYRRLREVESRFENTFDWIYHRKETQFTEWLQSGTGLFWINGKPGSGKSTLMKFIYQDCRTHELLNDWKRDNMIQAAFFFHHRGNAVEKTFIGLLQSILFQIISKRRDLGRLLLEFDELQEGWNLEKLQRGLRRIIFQDEIPLHLCLFLFLDALDEYDGQLEFLCSFLKDLGDVHPSNTKTIKICFSSRPWEIFTTAFHNIPGFGIQDFTRGDIQDYCLGSMRNESANILQELVPEIVFRANGVFLWVKLVIKDLADGTKREQLSKDNLQEHLNAFPTELDEYYAEIIKRIPNTNRWKAYAMLEVIVRSTDRLRLSDVLVAVCSSNATTWDEAYHNWHTLLGRIGQIHNLGDIEKFSEERLKEYCGSLIEDLAEKQLKEYCGGLVEVVYVQGSSFVQVFHQTVEDFVKDPKFKTLVLGEQAKLTVENGHTFIGKGLFAEYWGLNNPNLRNEHTALHLRMVEHTTGRSIKTFLDSVPRHQFLMATSGTGSNPLIYAVRTGLSLYIKESLSYTPNLLRDSDEKLLTHALKSLSTIDFEQLSTSQDSTTIIRLLLNNGFTLDQDHGAFQVLMNLIYDSRSNDEHVTLLQSFIEHGQEVNVGVVCPVFGKYKGFINYTPLHASWKNPRLIALLLDNGADVNGLDEIQMTVVDRIIDSIPEESPSLCYESISILLQRGGKVNTTTRATRENFLEELSRAGFETERLQFRRLGVPTGKRKRKSKRHVPTPKPQPNCVIL